MAYPNFSEERKLWKKGYRRIVGLDEAGRGPLAGPVVAAAVMLKISNDKFLIQKQFQNFKFKKEFKKQPYGESLASLDPAKSKCSKRVFRILNFGHWDLFGIWNLGFGISEVRDSKKLSQKQREKIYKKIIKNPAIEWGIGRVSEKVIDKINIKNAAELAMEKALKNLEKKMRKKSDFLIIDGNQLKNYKLRTKNYKLIIKADEKVFSCAAASIIAKVYRDAVMKRCHKKYPKYNFAQHKGYPTKFHRAILKKYGPCEIHRKTFKPVRQLKAKSVKRKTIPISSRILDKVGTAKS